MSCDAALAFALHLAAARGAPMRWRPATVSPTIAAATAEANPLTREPLFAAIVRSARALEAQADDLRRPSGRPRDVAGSTTWTDFRARALQLAALDMQGHLELARRGTDGDLKCILRGLSQDLPRKLDAVDAAAGDDDRRLHLDELFYLLRDNVETLTAPVRPAA